MKDQQRFIEIFNQYITRDGSQEMLSFLQSNSSDFFTAPASTRFHGAYEGGLVEHSLNVYDCLESYLQTQRAEQKFGLSYTKESIAIVAFLHDVCKIGCYKPSFRNVKDESGVWKRVSTFEYQDDLPYGHGEKSVYIITGYMKLTREEAFAIRYHMGFSGSEDMRNISKAFTLFPLSLALHIADMEATAFLEKP